MEFQDHPCFSDNARHRFGRIHLPVAPACNMQCNYCRRDYDCVNESRPGVTRATLTPQQASRYLETVLNRIGNISVAGIAGPGDPFANGFETIETLRLVREKFPDLLLCVSTNGLELTKHVDELAALRISHVTLTVNAVNEEIGSRIYAWARLGGRVYRGIDAAGIIFEKQMEGIRRLKEKGIIVKINTVVIPGVNDGHVVEVAMVVSKMGADIMNCIPMYHVMGTVFEGIPPPAVEVMEKIRKEAGVYIPQMSHCVRCRADAAGMIGDRQSEEAQSLLENASRTWVTPDKPYVAVASMEGLFVNQHLGEAASLWIFGDHDGKIEVIDLRSTPPPGEGLERWRKMAVLLRDCNTVLAGGVGANPKTVLEQSGINVVVMEGLAMEGVEPILRGEEIPKILLRLPGRCGIGKGCSGTGMGCG
ncbi:MAG: nitrogenase cofactor biosynthesis protein NifB [Smithella sp.]